MKTLNVPNLKAAEGISIMAIPRRATYKAVHADSDMEDLLDKAINQNYVRLSMIRDTLSVSLPVKKSSNIATKNLRNM